MALAEAMGVTASLPAYPSAWPAILLPVLLTGRPQGLYFTSLLPSALSVPQRVG